MMMRKSYPLLKRAVDSFEWEEFSGIYVRGPVGVGKSYLLYLLAAEYRMDRNHYRVTYINDCGSWKNSEFRYILRELVTTFYDDTIDGKSIVELCQTVTGSESKEKMEILIYALVAYVKQNNLRWIIICDQHNALYRHKVLVDEFPYHIINLLSDQQSPNITVVISASANNEGYPTELNGWLTHDISSHRFDQEEFKVLLA